MGNKASKKIGNEEINNEVFVVIDLPVPTLIVDAPPCITDIVMGLSRTLILADNVSIENIDCIILFWLRLMSFTKQIPNDVIRIIYDIIIVSKVLYIQQKKIV